MIPVAIHDHTGIRLADIVWTGTRFLYVENTTNAIWSPGSPPTLYASMPRAVEETRCALSPGAHGFPAGVLFCHSPDNLIYRVGADGTVSVAATLPPSPVSDGAIAFDRVGRFGYALLAATGRSGNPTAGGRVFAISANGRVRTIGRYGAPGAGGADTMIVAPARFGSIAGQAVLTVDAGKHGALVAMSPAGTTRVIARLPDGPNPIVAVPPRGAPHTPGAPRGLYVTDTNSTNVFYIPARGLAPYAGDLIVGSEIQARFWAIAPHGAGFRVLRLPLTLPGSGLNLEGATYVD